MLRRFLGYWYNKIPLKTKLIYILILFFLIPIFIIGYFGYMNYTNTMRSKLISNSQSTVKEMSALMAGRIEKLNKFSLRILYDRRIYDTYRNLSLYNLDYLGQNDFQEYLQSLLYSKDELSEILIRFSIDKKDRTFQVNKTLEPGMESSKHLSALYNCALKGSGKPVWYISEDQGKVTGIFITKIIYDLRDVSKEIGYIVFKVDERLLFELFEPFTHYIGQDISLFTNDGVELFNTDMASKNNGSILSRYLSQHSSQEVYETKTSNDNIFFIQKEVQPLEWKLVISISSNILFKDIRNTSQFILLLCISTIPICLLLINFVYIDFLKPINMLTNKMKQIEKGDFGITIDNHRSNELGFVFRTFNKMSLEISNLINKVYKGQIAMKEAQIKSLQAQINPHFLYNTLESINWKAQLYGAEEISDMVTALSTIIEANLNRDNENLVTLRREIDYINNYKLLIQKRFKQKITLSTDVPDELLDCTIPKLSIQPIVENAVYHGLEKKKGSGIIQLSIEKEESDLLIKVADNGFGISHDKLEKIKSELSNLEENENIIRFQNISRIGILNVHKRIRLLYGTNYGLNIESKAGEGTTVVIRIPYEKPEGVEINV